MMLANPHKSAILGKIMVPLAGLPPLFGIKAVALANHPKSRARMLGVPLDLANPLAPARG